MSIQARFEFTFSGVKRIGLIDTPRRPAILPPLGYAYHAAPKLAVPKTCPPAFLSIVSDIARRVALEQCGRLPADQPGLSF